MTETTKQRGFSRRNFIKGAATLTAAGALVGCSPQGKNLEEADKKAEAPEEQIFAGACRGNCAGGCFLNIHVRDGQVVRTTARDMPDTRYNRICVKGLTHVGRIYSSERLQYPMKRTGERGEGKFERISWDEAIETIATKWTGYVEEFGPESMAIMFGSGNYAVCSGQGSPNITTRFRNVAGASLIEANVDAAPGVTRGYSIGSISGTTGNNEPADLLNSKTIVCWGSNPVVSQVQSMHFIMEAKEQGTRYVVIDPQFNTNASKADVFIPVNSSTDGALAMGALRELFEQNWQDHEYILKHTNAPLLILGKDQATLFSEMRKTYSILYLTPGSDVPVFPYEAAFRFVADGRKGSPALFRSPVTLDVERHMREAGVLPKNARTEPCDSVFEEFEFLSYLFACKAEALRREDALAEAEWLARITSFCEEHARLWLPEFMARTKEAVLDAGADQSYANLAEFASRALSQIGQDEGSNKLQKC